ncbi:MAG: hypothetical protein GY838_18405 [bacterium]|nr:hypothetical protein [bacterium]
MKTLITTLIVVALLVPALALGYNENNIGMYITETPSGANADATLNTAAPGTYDVYLVLTNAYNWAQFSPITTVGGFECSLTLPENWTFSGVSLPPNVLDLNNDPAHFYCSGQIPVTGGTATLATITLLTFDPTPGLAYIAPYFASPSIPGSMAITDADREFALEAAYPASGDYAEPIFGLNMGVIPDEDVSWGEVKSLYR